MNLCLSLMEQSAGGLWVVQVTWFIVIYAIRQPQMCIPSGDHKAPNHQINFSLPPLPSLPNRFIREEDFLLTLGLNPHLGVLLQGRHSRFLPIKQAFVSFCTLCSCHVPFCTFSFMCRIQ